MSELPPALAERFGMNNSEPSDTATMLDWSLYWAGQGVCVCPCVRWLGTPLMSPRWHRDATIIKSTIVEWWTEWPDADIRAVPDKSGHFVLVAAGDEGEESLAALEAEHGELPTTLRYWTPEFQAWGGNTRYWGSNQHLWIKGTARTSHNELGPGLHVLGAGQFVYLPNSFTPDCITLLERK